MNYNKENASSKGYLILGKMWIVEIFLSVILSIVVLSIDRSGMRIIGTGEICICVFSMMTVFFGCIMYYASMQEKKKILWIISTIGIISVPVLATIGALAASLIQQDEIGIILIVISILNLIIIPILLTSFSFIYEKNFTLVACFFITTVSMVVFFPFYMNIEISNGLIMLGINMLIGLLFSMFLRIYNRLPSNLMKLSVQIMIIIGAISNLIWGFVTDTDVFLKALYVIIALGLFYTAYLFINEFDTSGFR